MRILFVNPTLGEAYGQEQALGDLSSALQRRGHRVYGLADYVVGHKPTFSGYALVPSLSQLNWLDPRARRTIQQALHYVELIQPDLIHLHDTFDARLLDAFRVRRPTLYTAHTFAASCPASTRLAAGKVCEKRSGYRCLLADRIHPCLHGFKNRLRKWHAVESYRRRTRVLKKFAALIAVSPYMAHTLTEEGYPADRIHCIPNAVSVSAIGPLPQVPPNLIVCASRLVEHKGIAMALHALAQLRDIPWTFWIFGEGPERRRLETLICALKLENRVQIRPRISRSDLHGYFRAARVLLQPNIGPEPFGLVVAEAIALGLPVIAARVPAIQAHAKGVCFFKPNSSNELAAQLRKELSEPSKPVKQSHTTRPPDEQTVLFTEKLYESVLSKQGLSGAHAYGLRTRAVQS